MANRVDKGHDATQELSASQLVADMPPRRPNPQNDASLWMRNVVSSDDFAPTRPAAPSKRIWPFVLLGAIAIAAVIGGYIVFIKGGDKPSTAAAALPVAAAPPTTSTPAPATPAVAVPAPPAVPATPTTPAAQSASLDMTAAAAATAEVGVADAAAIAKAAASASSGITEPKKARKQTKPAATKKTVAKPTASKPPPKRK